MNVIYQQKPDIHFRQLDGESFLADGENNAMFNLNALGTAVWRVLVNPMTTDEVVELFSDAFPDTDASRIKSDVLALFEDMAKAGIIVEVDPSEDQEK